MTYTFDFSVLLPYWETLLSGCWLSLLMTTLSLIFGLGIGLLTLLALRSRYRLLGLVATSYVETIRNTPFLVQVLFLYFGLPTLGFALTPWPAAVLALSLSHTGLRANKLTHALFPGNVPNTCPADFV